MVQGSVAVSRAGARYDCTHDNSRGDDCLLFEFHDDALELLDRRNALHTIDALTPISQIAVLGEPGQAVIDGCCDLQPRR